MLSRIFWIGLAGVALVVGIILQDGRGILSWGDESGHSRSVGDRIEAQVDRAIDRSFDRMTVLDADGDEVEVPVETKRALAGAVGELVEAETDLAMLKVRDGSEAEIAAANARRDQARAQVDTLKENIQRQTELARDQRAMIRDQVRDEVRDTVREAVRN